MTRRTPLLKPLLVEAILVSLLFAGVFALCFWPVLSGTYLWIFLDESSEAFMRFSYYLHALRNNGSVFWDGNINLWTQETPSTPLFSPITLAMLAIALLFRMEALESQALLFASFSFIMQIGIGISMYCFLRKLKFSILASMVGGVGYGYNYFSVAYGILGGQFRAAALLILPLVFIFALDLFSKKEFLLKNIGKTGLTFGLCLISNGDVKPTIQFLLPLSLFALALGKPVHGLGKTVLYFFITIGLGVSLATVQLYPTYEALKESKKSEWQKTGPTLEEPSHINTLLGFSQNPISAVMGFLFPNTYLKVARATSLAPYVEHPEAHKFTFSFFFLLLAFLGLFKNCKLQFTWVTTGILTLLYMLSGSLPFAPFFAWLSRVLHVRYPTRASIVVYFVLAIFVAQGVDFLKNQKQLVSLLKQKRSDLKLIVPALFLLMVGMVLWQWGKAFPREYFELFLSLSHLSFAFFLIALTMYLLKFVMSDSRWTHYAKFIAFLFFCIGAFLFAALSKWTGASSELLTETSTLFLDTFLFCLLVGLSLSKVRGVNSLAIGFLVIGVFRFIQMNELPRVPSAFRNSPQTINERDPELEVVYTDVDHASYRIYLPARFRKTVTTSHGFSRSFNNYCCRQFIDDFRFAFGADNGTLEQFQYKDSLDLNSGYSSAGLANHNIRYVIDDFEKYPNLLPKDPNSYKFLSKHVIQLKKTRPLVQFENIKHEPLPASVVINHYASGRLQATVETQEEGLFVFSEMYAKSWAATINGVRQNILKAPAAFQAITLPPGKHKVYFNYSPYNSYQMWLATFVSLLSFATLTFAISKKSNH